jgi:hypothetical protein
MFLNYFEVLMLKIIFKKYYFDVFSSKKHFENQTATTLSNAP